MPRTPEGADFWLYQCRGPVCGGTDGDARLESARRMVSALPGAVLVSSDCLGPCHGAPVLLVTWQVGARSGALWLTGLGDRELRALGSWLEAGASAPLPSVLTRCRLRAQATPARAFLN